MIDSDHPYNFVKNLAAEDGIEFTFSKYIYAPDSIFDQRVLLQISGKSLTLEKVNNEISSLAENEELAIHSRLQIRGRSYHMPMIDFSTTQAIDGEVFDRMSRYLPKKIMLNMALYASGHSYHAYSITLLSPREWIHFMGRLLLINPHNRNDIIDTRWVGHRLIGGYGSLRWSNNAKRYSCPPKRVGFYEELHTSGEY